MREQIIRLDSQLSEEYEVKVGMYQGSVSHLIMHWWWMLSLNLPERVHQMSHCMLTT